MNPYGHDHVLGRIVQIVPVDSWYAEYRGDDGKPFHMRLVAWALVEGTEGEYRGDQEVRGLGCDAEEGVEFADDVANFVRYVHADTLTEELAMPVAPRNAGAVA
ncbi:MAG: hypothetical protein ACRDTT_08300 [Pseudonocardiaceae bacterium]